MDPKNRLKNPPINPFSFAVPTQLKVLAECKAPNRLKQTKQAPAGADIP
jgi:hypothetical protein